MSEKNDEREDIKESLSEEHTAIKEYADRGEEAKDPKVKHQYARIRKDEKEHAAHFKKLLSEQFD